MLRTLFGTLTLGLLALFCQHAPAEATAVHARSPLSSARTDATNTTPAQDAAVTVAPSPTANTLVVMTFNLRYASDQAPNSWAARKPVLVEQIRREAPDVLGTQEGLWRQIQDLVVALPEYGWVRLGREGGSHGEFGAIFYRRARFQVLEFDHFWLSDTPDRIGSSSWGNQVVRMVTWARLLDRKTEAEFVVYNTHFDHQVQAAREESAKLLLARGQAHFANWPVLITGDFNAVAGKNAAYTTLVGAGRYQDAWTTALERGPEVSTFHGYGGPDAGRGRIDWILHNERWKTLSAHVATYSDAGQFPSDHFPVVATFALLPRD